MPVARRNPFEKTDQKLLEAFVVASTVDELFTALRTWCAYYLNVELNPKQEILVLAGIDLAAFRSKPLIYEFLWKIKNILAIGAIRSGKTFAETVAILFKMWLLPQIDCANVAPSVDQAATMYRHMVTLVNEPNFQKFCIQPDGKDGIVKHPHPAIWLWNGSNCEFRSSGYECELLRSREWDIINADECQLFRETGIRTLRGRVLGSKGGRRRIGVFSLTGSPLSNVVWLREMFNASNIENPRRNPRDLALRFSIMDNVRILGSDAIEELKRAYAYNPRFVQQELNGEFLDSQEHPFPNFEAAYLQAQDDSGEVQALETEIMQQSGMDVWDNGIFEYSLPPIQGHQYVQGWDIGRGRMTQSKHLEELMGRRGATVGVVLDITHKPWRQVALHYQARTYEWPQVIELWRSWKVKYDAQLAVDAGGPGDPVVEWARDMGVGVDTPINWTGGITRGNAVSKGAAMAALQLVYANEWLKAPFVKVPYEQVNHYDPSDDSMPQDYVMALSAATWIARQQDFPTIDLGSNARLGLPISPDQVEIEHYREPPMRRIPGVS